MSSLVFLFAAFRAAFRIFVGCLLLVTAAAPLSLAQMRGARIMGGRARAGPALVNRAPSAVSPGRGFTRSQVLHPGFATGRFPFRHHRHFNFFLANACFNDPFFDPFVCQRFLFRNAVFFSEPLFVPYPVYQEAVYADGDQSQTTEQNEEADLSQRIDRLTDEVESLRAQRESNKSPQPQVNQQKQELEANLPTRTLVFRDGHRSEIHNYAIVGDTLWALTEERAQKIPMSDLDLDATKKTNADQGIEFP